jgi:SAM-dependent methyltransferase
MSEQQYFDANRARWNELVDIHAKSEFYDFEGFKAGKLSLDALEREGLGDVTGKTLLHLMCHFGMSTLSWARLGATVTGVDFSDQAIALARRLSDELDIPATFVQANIYDLPAVLDAREAFDIVFTSYGVLTWLSDTTRWAEVVAHFLKPGGTFYIVEIHPFPEVFENHPGSPRLEVEYSYFHKDKPTAWDVEGSYADPGAEIEQDVQYEWQHSMSDIVNALIGAGLKIEALHEYPQCCFAMFPELMERRADGWWWLKDGRDCIPFTFAIKATK